MNIFSQILFFITSFIYALMPMTTYTEGLTGQPQSFLPHQIESQNDATISHLIYRGLFTYDIYGKLIPDLAESWTISNEGLVYTIKLKDNQFWTDGTKITSDDLIYTSFKVVDLQGVATDKVDDLTVRYTLPNKFSPFLSLMTVGVMQNLSEENYNSLTPVSSGDFRVLRVQKSGPLVKEVELLNQDKAHQIKKLIFRYYSNEEELVTAAKLGEIDAFLARDEYTELANFTNHRFPLQGVYYALYFNLANEKFNDIIDRQNLRKVLNIEEIIFNKGIFVEGPISRSPFTNENIEFDKYDKTFTAVMGYLDITIKIPDLQQHREVAKQVRDFWDDKLGVNVAIEEVDPATFVEDVVVPRNYEVLLFGQEIGRDPDRYINWHSTQNVPPGLNLSNFNQVRADRALEEGRNETDVDVRSIHYDEFQDVVDTEVPAIFLYHPYRNYYVSNRVRGIGEKYTFTQSDRFLDFSNWKILRAN